MKTLIKMARESGYVKTVQGGAEVSMASMDCLERFAELVRADEREACAKLVEQGLPIASSLSALDDMEMWGEKFAAAIRARGNS